MNSEPDTSSLAMAQNNSSGIGADDQHQPPRPAQPNDAYLLRKLGPELLDMIMTYSSSDKYPGPRLKPVRMVKLSFELLKWNEVSHGLSLVAGKRIWRILLLWDDKEVDLVQKAIDASGGRNGRVGSSIKMIYTVFRWRQNLDPVSTLASSCSNLVRLDAPVMHLGPIGPPANNSTSHFHRLKVLSIFGNRKKPHEGFNALVLAGLVALEHFTIDTRLDIPPGCPAPAFSLVSLTWQGRSQPEAVSWLLQNSTALRVLMLRVAGFALLQQCLIQHGTTLLSLRLLSQGSITPDLFPQMFDLINTYSPNLLELLLDVCPETSLFDRLPRTLQHIGLKPGKKAEIFSEDAFINWISGLPHIQRLTLWGKHPQHLLKWSNSKHPIPEHKAFKQDIPTIKQWKENALIHFAPPHDSDLEWPFEDTKDIDYTSPVVPNRRFPSL